MKAVLNVGGGTSKVGIPTYYACWRHDRLDIDPAVKPDILLDARNLTTLPAATHDAVLCAHNLEHYHRHEGAKVLRGIHHVLKPDGFAEIRVPDLEFAFDEIARKKLDVDDVLYGSRVGPILVRDVLWGYHREIERTGREFYTHKTGFTKKALLRFLADAGFPHYVIGNLEPQEIVGYFFKQAPTDEQMQLIGARRQ